MITNSNKVTIFGKEVTFTSEQAAELKNKGYEFNKSLMELICMQNNVWDLENKDNSECVAIVFDSVANYEKIMKSSFIALAKEGLL